MLLKNFILSLLLLIAVLNNFAQAEQVSLKPFVSGSYQQLLTTNTNHPFMLVVWSVTCSSCLKDMALLNSLHKSKPDLKIVMLSTDGTEVSQQVKNILQKNELATVENWNYADENAAKLQYEIDSSWYGELPRTYFFDKRHQREGISGVLTEADYLKHFEKILK